MLLASLVERKSMLCPAFISAQAAFDDQPWRHVCLTSKKFHDAGHFPMARASAVALETSQQTPMAPKQQQLHGCNTASEVQAIRGIDLSLSFFARHHLGCDCKADTSCLCT